MRAFAILMLTVLVAAGAGLFMIKGPDGRPLLTVQETFPSVAQLRAGAVRQWDRLTGQLAEVTGTEPPAGGNSADAVTFYRWQDAQGVWHYSSEPDPQGRSEAFLVDPQNPSSGPSSPAPAAAVAPPGQQQGSFGAEPPSRSPKRVKQLIDDVRGVQDLLEQRAQETEQATRD